MNKLFPATAIALSLVAGSAFAAGADGASFPSLQPAQAATLTRAQVHAEAVQVRNTQYAYTADGSVVTVSTPAAAPRVRAAVKAEVAKPVLISATGNATTPY